MAIMANQEQISIEDLTIKLAEILGDDLAQSLVRTARTPDEFSLNLQLLSNDGISQLSPEQKEQTLLLLTKYSQS